MKHIIVGQQEALIKKGLRPVTRLLVSSQYVSKKP